MFFEAKRLNEGSMGLPSLPPSPVCEFLLPLHRGQVHAKLPKLARKFATDMTHT